MICRRCKLWGAKTNCMRGEGSDRPIVLFVGEAPGKNEDEQGIPFVGKSGKYLRDMVAEANENDWSIRFTNVVRCRPPNNREPDKREICACRFFLKSEIAKCDPKIIVPLGNIPLLSLLGITGISEYRGRRFWRDGRAIIPEFHPSYVIRGLEQGDKEASTLFNGGLLRIFSDEALERRQPKIDVVHVEEAYKRLDDEAKEFAFDIEATGLDPWKKDAKVHCVGFSYKPNHALVVDVPDAVWEFPIDRRKALKVGGCTRELWYFHRIFEELEIPKTAQSGKYDVLYLREVLGIEVVNWKYDTMVMDYTLDENRGHSLDALIARFLFPYSGHKDLMRQSIGKRKADITEGVFAGASLEDLHNYNGINAATTFMLKEILWEKICAAGLQNYYEILQNIACHLIEVESFGCPIDVEKAKSLSKKLQARMSGVLKRLKRRESIQRFETNSEKEFNPGSSLQIVEVLYGIEGLEPKAKTQKKKPSTKAEHLTALHNKTATLIVEWKQYQKLFSTYTGEAALGWIHNDGFVHSQYNSDTSSGRLSSKEPNLQNIPRESTSGEEFLIKDMFVSRFKNGRIVTADYSQIELRIFAVLANCKKMLTVFKEGGDIHAAVGSEIFGVPVEVIQKDEGKRADAKRANFGILYGETEKGLQQHHGKTLSYWRSFLKSYYKSYPELLSHRRKTKQMLLTYGYVESPFGARRHFSHYKKSQDMKRKAGWEREAANHPIQNAAWTLTALSGIRLQEAFKKEGLRARIFNYVHDQLLVDAPQEEIDRVCELMLMIMENPEIAWLNIPTPIDLGIGRTWGTTQKLL